MIVMDDAPSSGAHPAGRLSGKVQGPAVVEELLSSIFVAPTHAEALYRAGQLKPGESVIEPTGVWRGRGWLRR